MREKLMQAVILTLLLKLILGFNSPTRTSQQTEVPVRQNSAPLASYVLRLPPLNLRW